jgi:hypothetical protein
MKELIWAVLIQKLQTTEKIFLQPILDPVLN